MTNAELKEIAGDFDIKYENLKELRMKVSKYFELQRMVQRYLAKAYDGWAVGDTQIWDAITVYTEDAKIDLTDEKLNIDQTVPAVAQVFMEHHERVSTAMANLDDAFLNWCANKDKKSSDALNDTFKVLKGE